jgi:hypothetical protein
VEAVTHAFTGAAALSIEIDLPADGSVESPADNAGD